MEKQQDPDLIYLPVSVGEAMDKLTILDIKRQRIKDPKKKIQVELEYHLLLEKLDSVVQSVGNYYHLLKILNEEIWDQMDILRNYQNKRDEYYAQLCLDCIQYNDRRFRVKNKINNHARSGIKEQKGYHVFRKALDCRASLLELGLDELQKVVHYVSILYDQVVVLADKEMYIKLQNHFKNDPTIEILEIQDETDTTEFEMVSTLEDIKKLGIEEVTRQKYWEFL